MAAAALTALSLLAIPLASCSAQTTSAKSGKPLESAARGSFAITEMGTFDEPWALAFEPGTGNLFVTEKAGRIKFVQANGRLGTVTGAPKVDYGGQGGLGDIAFAPDYVISRMIYLSWVEAGDADTRGAVVGRARLICAEHDSCALENLQTIWRQDPKVTGRGHFSHRLAFSPDGSYLFVASGERQKFTPAQDIAVNLGKVLRLNLDGTPADGNPMEAKGGVSAQIWTLGHRNILGLEFDPAGRLWDLEHGPAGGDELNLVRAGANYGWPIVSQGDHYDGKPIPRHPTRPEFAAPAISWNPVIAPGGFIFHSGKAFPAWRGQALIAGMVSEGLVRVAIDGETAREVERIPLGKRIRAIAEGPDGAVWIAEDGKGARLRKLTPKS
ncbi:MAG TPA: PQQ-dependent sugar dehydrogenase [Novosphingobium sp.]|nr:PQQ-dependent sugar dehydrogenase [Novosphingobium sp.]